MRVGNVDCFATELQDDCGFISPVSANNCHLPVRDVYRYNPWRLKVQTARKLRRQERDICSDDKRWL